MIIEATLIDYLIRANIPGVNGNVYAETPKVIPEEYIVIDKTGNSHTNGIDRATIAIQSISSHSLLVAAQINSDVINAMGDFTGVENIFGVHLQSDYNFTNQATKQYRYQAVFEITYKR